VHFGAKNDNGTIAGRRIHSSATLNPELNRIKGDVKNNPKNRTKLTCFVPLKVVQSQYSKPYGGPMSEFGWILVEVIIAILAIGMYGYSLVEKLEDVEEY